MIADYPLGSGGEAAFTSPRGVYLYCSIFEPEFRAVHNGPLDIAAGWGIQGLTLLLALLAGSAVAAFRAPGIDLTCGRSASGVLGPVSLLAALAGQIVCSMFTSVLDGEWFLWLAASCLVYARLVAGLIRQLDQRRRTNWTGPKLMICWTMQPSTDAGSVDTLTVH